jgi:membrane-associated phospholipid phosphatase
MTSSESSSTFSFLDAIDKKISSPFFLAILPSSALEFALSIPGNFFGSCTFATVTCPALIAAFFDLVDEEKQSIMSFWHGCVLVLLVLNIAIWRLVLTAEKDKSTHKFARQIFYGPLFSALGPFLGVALLKSGAANISENAIQNGFLQISLWLIGVIPSAIIKPVVRRQRPAARARSQTANGEAKLYNAARDKHFTILPRILAKDTFHSMPSGDAAGAMASMYGLLFLQSETSTAIVFLGCICILLSCIGRMYFLAHHFCDVLVGVVTSFLACKLFQGIMCDAIVCQVNWWTPLLAHGLLIVVVIVTRLLCTKDKVFDAGTVKND